MLIRSEKCPNIKIKSLTVKDIKNLSMTNFDEEDASMYISKLIINNSSLAIIDNATIGLLFIDILKLSDIELDEEVIKDLKRISSIANTHIHIFLRDDNPIAKKELKELCVKVMKYIQYDIKSLYKDFIKLHKKIHIQPSELDSLFFWEYKLYLKNI